MTASPFTHGEDGVITATEIEDLTEEYGFGSIELEASGVATDDDIQEFGVSIAPGTAAAFAVIEYVWAKHLASKLAESTASDGENLLAQIENLASLHDAGTLSDGEFSAAKAKLLG